LAWVAIGLMVLLVVSLGLSLREERHLRIKAEGSDAWATFLERSIADGHTLLQIEDGFVFRDEHHAWHERVYSWLLEHRSLREAQDFGNAASAPGRHAWAAAQLAFLEGLQNRH
jgi:hypothetical protein